MKKTGPPPIDPEFLIDFLASLDDPRIDRTKNMTSSIFLLLQFVLLFAGQNLGSQLRILEKQKRSGSKSF